MNIALWIGQAALAAMFLVVGVNHAFRFEQSVANPRMAWGRAVGRSNMRTIGLLEIAGGIGLIVPALAGILSWLTPLAAASLALLMLAAAVFHVRRGEQLLPNIVLGAFAAFVAFGRFSIAPF